MLLKLFGGWGWDTVKHFLIFLDSSRSVSYTHLDVYKRQPLMGVSSLAVVFGPYEIYPGSGKPIVIIVIVLWVTSIIIIIPFLSLIHI